MSCVLGYIFNTYCVHKRVHPSILFTVVFKPVIFRAKGNTILKTEMQAVAECLCLRKY